MKKFKIVVFVPGNYMKTIMDNLSKEIDTLYPNYDYVFSYTDVEGTWRPIEGANPFDGEIGKIQYGNEKRLEFSLYEKDIKKAIKVVLQNHPYEEPVIDIYEFKSYRDFL